MQEKKRSLRRKLGSVKSYLDTYPIIVVLVILLSLLGGIIYSQRYNHQKSAIDTAEYATDPILSVNYVDTHAAGARDDKIVMTFSDVVHPDMVSSHFYLSPAVKGKFIHGSGMNSVEFIPDRPFDRGATYSLKIAEGLMSGNGNMLIDDYILTFHSKLEENEVLFKKDTISGRMLSIPASKQTNLSVEGISRFDNVVLTLYRSNRTQLLKNLSYAKRNDAIRNDGGIGYENYVHQQIQHTREEKIRTLPFDKNKETLSLQLPTGIYYLEASEGGKTPLGSTILVVTNTGITFRQDDKKIILSGFDIATGAKLASSITVDLYTFMEEPTMIASHTFPGHETSIPFPFTTRLDALIGSNGNDTFVIPVRIPQSLADIRVYSDLDQDMKVFLYTDRPIYQPNDTVYFRGIVRVDSDALYKIPPAGRKVRVWINSGEKPAIDLEVTTDQTGAFSGEFIIPESSDNAYSSPGASTLYLYASATPNQEVWDADGSAYFDVVEYVKPTVDISTAVQKSEYLRNEKLSFTISGKYMNGKPLANKTILYSFYGQTYFESERSVSNKNFNITMQGGMCGGGITSSEEYYGEQLPKDGEVRLDKDGNATVTLSLPEGVTTSQTITMVARTTDGTNEIVSAVNTIVHAGEFNIFMMPSANFYTYGSEMVQPFYAETLDGKKISNTEFVYKLKTISYQSETNKSVEKILSTGKVRTDENGQGIARQSLPEKLDNESLYIVIEGSDEKKNTIQTTDSLVLVDKNNTEQVSWWNRGSLAQTYLKILSNSNSFVVGNEIVLSVQSPAEIDAMMSLERGRIYEPSLVHLTKGQNTIRIPVTEALSPSITVVFSFFADGSYHTEGLSLNIPAMHKLLQIQISSDKKIYQPGESAILSVATKDSTGQGVSATFSLGVIDKAIFGLRKNATPALHSTFYYFRDRRTNASSSLTSIGNDFGGGGGGGGGGMSGPAKTVDTLYWNPNLTTDATGEARVTIPLKGGSTTWKAQVVGSTTTTKVGQGETEFIVSD